MTHDELLSPTPSNPAHAQNYATLFRLRKKAQSEYTNPDEQEFNDWDRQVQALLTQSERAFYVSPFGALDMNVLEFRSVSRVNHLMKILVHRQGIKTSNGFNG
jgi:uncharacterized protein YecE (DUF72 family)